MIRNPGNQPGLALHSPPDHYTGSPGSLFGRQRGGRRGSAHQ